MRSQIAYMMAVGCLLLGVSFGHGQGGGGPGGNVVNNSVFATKMGNKVIQPVGTCTINANTIEPRVSVEYGTIDDKGKQTMVATNQPTSLAVNGTGYTWSPPADFSPITPATTYYVKASLYGKQKGMPPGAEVFLASNEVILYP